MGLCYSIKVISRTKTMSVLLRPTSRTDLGDSAWSHLSRCNVKYTDAYVMDVRVSIAASDEPAPI